jgi:HPt (histidine-containing phosphotransfer) domain-containing protein
LFLDEGFQAFVSKPISLTKLDAVIRQWIMNEDADTFEATTDATTDATTKKSEIVVDIPGINATLGLSLYEGDTEIFLEILRSYADNVPTELSRMQNLNESNLPDYAIDIHTMKGASASIGAKSLTTKAKRIEKMAKDGDYDGVLSENNSFIQEAKTLVKNIKNFLAN